MTPALLFLQKLHDALASLCPAVGQHSCRLVWHAICLKPCPAGPAIELPPICIFAFYSGATLLQAAYSICISVPLQTSDCLTHLRLFFVLQWGNTPAGRFVPGPPDGSYATCMCPNAATHGDVIVYDAELDEYYCAPHAQFLEDAPGSSRGVWAPALQPAQQRCSSAATCYDMCFHCDGSPRYQPTVSTASLLYCCVLGIDARCSSDDYSRVLPEAALSSWQQSAWLLKLYYWLVMRQNCPSQSPAFCVFARTAPVLWQTVLRSWQYHAVLARLVPSPAAGGVTRHACKTLHAFSSLSSSCGPYPCSVHSALEIHRHLDNVASAIACRCHLLLG
jgi:hypothetical protein